MMTLKEIRDKLLTLGIPVAYLQFSTPQTMPYIAYYESDTEITGADNYNMYRDVEITIELYTGKKDLTLERKIENLFRDVEIEKDGDTAIKQDGGNAILVLYTFRTIQYIEEDTE